MAMLMVTEKEILNLLIEQIRNGAVNVIKGINDVNNDGVVDTADVATLLQKVLNSNFKMPCEPNVTEPTTVTTTVATTETTTKNTESSTEATTKNNDESTETTTNAPSPAGTQEHNVSDNGVKSDFYTFTSCSVATRNGTIDYEGLTLTDYIKLNSQASISFTNTTTGSLELAFNSQGTSVKIDGTAYTIPSSRVLKIENLAAGTHTIAKGDGESNLYYITYADNSSVDPTPTEVKGDANGDGKVTRDDMTMVLDFASGKISAVTNAKLADVSGDGKVTAYDAYLIGKIILG